MVALWGTVLLWAGLQIPTSVQADTGVQAQRITIAEAKPKVKQAPFGSWTSPLSAARLAQSAAMLGDIRVSNGTPYWFESRPAENGRYVIVTPDGKGGVRELTS